MLQKYHAIVLRVVKYNDTTRIVDLLTEEQGRFAVAVTSPASNPRKRKEKMVWQPLSMIELQIDIQRAKGLPKPKAVNVLYNYADLPYNPIKTMVALFIDELICNALWGEVPDRSTFQFIWNSLLYLDNTAGSCANFPIAFAVQLLKFIGLAPNTIRSHQQPFYDLVAAEYVDQLPAHKDYLKGLEADAVELFARVNYSNMKRFRINKMQRRRVLYLLNNYYAIHIPNFKQLNSLAIFQQALA